MPDISPTLTDALRLLDQQEARRPDTVPSEVLKATFFKTDFWNHQKPASSFIGSIMLFPGAVTESNIPQIEESFKNGAVAAVLNPPEAAWLKKQIPALRERIFATSLETDWLDLASSLRALCTGQIARETAGLRKGDLFALAQSLATVAGGAISIVDSAGRIVGYSTLPHQKIDAMRRETTLTLQEEGPIKLDEDYRRLNKTNTALWIPPSGNTLGRAAISIRAQGELLGAIWLIVVDPKDSDKACEFLESVVGLAAHHMLEARETNTAENQRASDLIQTVLNDEKFREEAYLELSLQEDATHTCVAFKFVDENEQNPILQALRHLHHIRLTAKAVFGDSRAAILGDKIVCIVPTKSLETTVTFGSGIAQATKVATRAGIGSFAKDAKDLARSISEALKILDLPTVKNSSLSDVSTIADAREKIGLTALFEALPGTGVLEHDLVAKLLQHDEEHKTELAQTLLHYLNALGSVSLTALDMHVHQNTVRQRLARIKSEIGIDLDDPSILLWCWIRLRAQLD